MAWLAAVLLFGAGCGDDEDRNGDRPPASPYLGLTYREAPRGVEGLGGALIGGVYAVSHIRRPRGQMLWLNRSVSPPDAAVPRWRVVGVLDLPRLRPGEVVAIGTCDVSSRRYPDLVAIWPTDRGADAPARLAWLANGPAERFERAPARRVNCREELAG